jgi:hypothetical protein
MMPPRAPIGVQNRKGRRFTPCGRLSTRYRKVVRLYPSIAAILINPGIIRCANSRHHYTASAARRTTEWPRAAPATAPSSGLAAASCLDPAEGPKAAQSLAIQTTGFAAGRHLALPCHRALHGSRGWRRSRQDHDTRADVHSAVEVLDIRIGRRMQPEDTKEPMVEGWLVP